MEHALTQEPTGSGTESRDRPRSMEEPGSMGTAGGQAERRGKQGSPAGVEGGQAGAGPGISGWGPQLEGQIRGSQAVLLH